MAEKGLLLVVSGPSGCGKGTVLAKALDECFAYSVSATTRAPRTGETDGVHYLFLTREEFRKCIDGDRMLEYAEYCGEYYGTPADRVDKQLADGLNVVLEIEVQGAMQVREKRPDAVLIFIAPPSEEELERRLRGRGTESEEKITQRLKKAAEELSFAEKYDYIIINDTVDEAAADFRAIVRAQQLRTGKENVSC